MAASDPLVQYMPESKCISAFRQYRDRSDEFRPRGCADNTVVNRKKLFARTTPYRKRNAAKAVYLYTGTMNSNVDSPYKNGATVLVDQRQRRRYRNFASEDFLVRLKSDGLLLAGRIGDISEHGINVFVPGTDPIRLPAENVRFAGELFGLPLARPLEFQAEFVWQSQSELNGRPCRVIGLRFAEEVELPDAVIAYDLSC